MYQSFDSTFALKMFLLLFSRMTARIRWRLPNQRYVSDFTFNLNQQSTKINFNQIDLLFHEVQRIPLNTIENPIKRTYIYQLN